MELILNRCIEYSDDRKNCVAHENGKRYFLENNTNYFITKVKSDKCLPQSVNEGRCDYLFLLRKENETSKAKFIELKGGAINDAIKQILDTINYLKSELTNYEIIARIVSSRNIPQINSTPYYKKLDKITNHNIRIATNKFLKETI